MQNNDSFQFISNKQRKKANKRKQAKAKALWEKVTGKNLNILLPKNPVKSLQNEDSVTELVDDTSPSIPSSSGVMSNTKQKEARTLLTQYPQKGFLKFKESSLQQIEKKRQAIDARKNTAVLKQLNPDDDVNLAEKWDDSVPIEPSTAAVDNKLKSQPLMTSQTIDKRHNPPVNTNTMSRFDSKFGPKVTDPKLVPQVAPTRNTSMSWFQNTANRRPTIPGMQYPTGIPRSLLMNPLPGITPPNATQMWVAPMSTTSTTNQFYPTTQFTTAPQHASQGLIITQSPNKSQGLLPTPSLIPKIAITKATSDSYNAGTIIITGKGWPMSMQPTPILVPTTSVNDPNSSIFVDTETKVNAEQAYSPSDVYAEGVANNQAYERKLLYAAEEDDDASSSNSGQKRMSAFQRLGPVSQPKKPKLTINVNLNKEQPVREVEYEVEEEPEKFTPVHLRQNIISSTDETVVKYLPFWPWRKLVQVRKSVSARDSKSVMMMEQEQMEEIYDKDNLFIQVTVNGYPPSWNKEDVLDAVIEATRGNSFIPCFTELSQRECTFLALRSRPALVALHKTGFVIRKNEIELTLTISQTCLTLNQIDFIPRIILRKRVSMGCNQNKLDLSAFTLKNDISHFLYFPLNRLANRIELMQLQGVVAWDNLVSLDLSHNRLTDIEGFELAQTTPQLKDLNLSHNYIERITELLKCRSLSLNTIQLEGNPLCLNYTDPDYYVKVIRMMFPCVKEIDGVPIHRRGYMPQIKRNYCPTECQDVVEKFLDIYFPILDYDEERALIQNLYDKNAVLTITYSDKLRYSAGFRSFSSLFIYARTGLFEEVDTDSVQGDKAIAKLIKKWPHTEHDPFTFTVDVMFHSESTTIFRVGGILKLTAETLADDEHILSFTKTIVLVTDNGTEYKICNEMLYWDEPTPAYARTAFRITTIKSKVPNLKVESTNDEDLKRTYLTIFMELTTLDMKVSKRCLELKNWNLKDAIEYFTKLLRMDNLDVLMKDQK